MANEPFRKEKLSGFPRLRAAYVNSVRGAGDVWRSEEAYRMQFWVLVGALPFAYLIADGFLDASILIGTIVLVMIVETLNTAIEAAIDRIGAEANELSRLAKDLGSWAVMLTMLLCGFVWLSAIADLILG